MPMNIAMNNTATVWSIYAMFSNIQTFSLDQNLFPQTLKAKFSSPEYFRKRYVDSAFQMKPMPFAPIRILSVQEMGRYASLLESVFPSCPSTWDSSVNHKNGEEQVTSDAP
jgi:hypothetical protein